MNWEEIKASNQHVYPATSITVFIMDTASGKPTTHWVDKAYQNYPYKNECMFNCLITVDLTDDFNSAKPQLDIADIENYFTVQLRSVCVCHLVARITTDNGINLELYVDDVENAIAKLNELEADVERFVEFDCEIQDDADWENVAEILN